jgi:L-threonylcarbamoyladenylate synthase
LARGAVLAVPTESSYGLAVDPRSRDGVEAVYRLKQRELGKPLPVVAADVEQLLALGVPAGSRALAWAAKRWPAALSVVLPLVPGSALPAAGGESSLAARIPAHAGLRALLAALGHALTATSANPSGGEPYLEPDALASWLSGVPEVETLIVDGGVLPGGPPSTLVEWAPDAVRVLRPGSYRL